MRRAPRTGHAHGRGVAGGIRGKLRSDDRLGGGEDRVWSGHTRSPNPPQCAACGVGKVEKDAAESVFNTMTDFSKKVFLNPTEEIFNRYISNFNEAIIIKPLITEAPLLEQEVITLASFEKLLVDCIADKDLFAAQQDELEFIYKTAFSKYNINVNKLKRYARRRSQLEKLNELLYKTTAK